MHSTHSTETHSLRSHAPSCIRSRMRPGVPTMMRVVIPSFALFAFLSMRTCGSFGTPPNTATLAMWNGLPSARSVSCVWIASSRVGATTSVVTVDTPGRPASLPSFISRVSAGMPKASVLPLLGYYIFSARDGMKCMRRTCRSRRCRRRRGPRGRAAMCTPGLGWAP